MNAHSSKQTVDVVTKQGESMVQAVTRGVLDPEVRHALIASNLAVHTLGSKIQLPTIEDYAAHLKRVTSNCAAGNKDLASRMLAAQAVTLDTLFSEMARRATLNLGEHLSATQTYAKLAFKAQSNCRATLEALARLHQPREQTVRHVHVNEGGQAIVADHFHHHAKEGRNEKADTQPHAPGADATGHIPPMPCPDAQGDAMPSPCDQRR